MERGGGEDAYLFRLFAPALSILMPDALVPQVFRFVQNLIGCEEQARVFKDEVSENAGSAPILRCPTGVTAVRHKFTLRSFRG